MAVHTMDAPQEVASESDHPGSVPPDPGGRSERRRESVEALVGRCLDPAFGLCVRAFDPIGSNPEWRDRARRIVMTSVAAAASRSRNPIADDSSVRHVIARVAEASLDELMDHPGAAPPPAGVDLTALMPSGFPMADMAPGGNLPYMVLQDAVAAARRVDRRVAFIVLAAGVPTDEAAVLLGIEESAVNQSLERIARRLADIHGVLDAGDQ